MQSSPSLTGAGLGDPTTADLSGRCVGSSYVLVCPVGHGATGTVWRAIDRASGEYVAVKLLHEGLLKQPKLVIRFVQERTILMMMRHRNIVGVRDLFSVGGSLALVMDYVSGGSLRNHLTSVGTLPPADAADLLAQVADALAKAHELGVVHRDVKPDNILLHDDGGRFEVRLTDFGIARVLDAAGLTTPQAIVGTPHYMAPEAIRGAAEPATDVYAVGIALYELVSGHPPYVGEPLAVLRRHLDESPERPPGLAQPVWDLIGWCLDQDPGRRPTAAELGPALRDLAALMAGAPALTMATVLTGEVTALVAGHPSIRPSSRRRPHNGPRSWKWRRPGLMVALMAVAVAVSGVGGFNAWQLIKSPDTTTAAPPAANPTGPARLGVSPAPVRPSAATASTQPLPSMPARPTAAGGAADAALPALEERRPSGAAGGGGAPAKIPTVPGPGVEPTIGAGADVEVAFGPWRCGDEYDWDLGHPVLARPCHAIGPSVRVVGQMEAMPGIQADIALTVRDANTDAVVAGPYTCKGLMFTDFALKHSCGPVELNPPRGGRYVLTETWEYTSRPLLPPGVARGPAFEW